MWSAESGEESDEEEGGGAKKVRRACSGGEWLILPRSCPLSCSGEDDGPVGLGEDAEVDDGGGGDEDGMEDFIVDDEEMEMEGEGEGEEVRVGGNGMVGVKTEGEWVAGGRKRHE